MFGSPELDGAITKKGYNKGEGPRERERERERERRSDERELT